MSETPAPAIPGTATQGMRELLHAVREGREAAVPKLVGALTDAERRACLPVLKSWRPIVRDRRDDRHVPVRAALRLAGVGCCTGVAAAAQWLSAGDLWWAGDDPALVAEALGHRDPEWLGRVAHRLAERRTVAEGAYPLIARLVHAAGCEPPTTDGVVLGWKLHVPTRGRTIRDSLRDDPFLTVMVPRLLEVPEACSDFQYSWSGEPGWPAALAGLAEEGRLSRDMLIDGCLSRLLAGGRPGVLRGFLALLTALDLTEDERAAHTLAWVRMLPDAHPLVAARAQVILAGLDDAGRLETEHLVEASEAALFRPEKKLVRAQLSMLDKAMRRQRSRTDELLRVAAEAFGHEEHSLQERALALVVRHRKHASGTALAGLAASAGRLGPDLRKRAAEALGGAVGAEDTGAPAVEDTGAPAVEGDLLPPAPSAERLEPAPATSAAIAEETGVLLRTEGTPAQWERVLNGLVVHAHADLPGLRTALEPVVAQPMPNGAADPLKRGLSTVLASLMGMPPQYRSVVREAVMQQCPHSALQAVPLIRAAEIAMRVKSDPLPFLLATPTWSTGTIAASELVARIAAYERSGAEPGQADLDQALLRVEREIPDEARQAAATLTSPAGRRLAAWLAAGGLPDPAAPATGPALRHSPHRRALVPTGGFSGYEDRPEPFRSLLAAHDPVGSPCRCWGGRPCSAHAFTVLPRHREVVAARMLLSFGDLAESDELGEGTPVLSALAASGGPAGPAAHLLVAYGLGARRTEGQLFAVDALLALAAGGQLDAARLGQGIAELTGLHRLKLQRIAAALREVVQAGAYATVWAVLSAALPPLLRGTAPHGLSALLSLAAECAERSGAHAGIPEIDELAARPGSSQLVRQARRIKSATAAGRRGGTG
ncbi:DUF7824 domain-containing protein [Streptomyces sp. enrichment culture]|uniref:DUF7824 domain-containing protein n=1 Tax=Streptomyces sp. enrichment culture TaxID=1795815 RepID=UPI003F567BC8